MKKITRQIYLLVILGIGVGVWASYAQAEELLGDVSDETSVSVFNEYPHDQETLLAPEMNYQGQDQEFVTQQKVFKSSSPGSDGARLDFSQTDLMERGVSDEQFQQPPVLDVLELKDMDIMDVLKLISKKSGLNIVAGTNVRGRITIYLRNVDVYDALRIILEANGLAYVRESGIIKVMGAKEFETRYGYAFGQETLTQVVKVQHVPALDLISALNQIKTATGVIIPEVHSNTLIITDRIDKIVLMKDFIAKADVPLVSKVFVLRYSKAQDVVKQIEGILTQNISKVEWDERSNKIIVKDTQEKIDRIEKLIAAFDERSPGVLIEAKIVQIILNNESKLGVDWEAVVSNYHNLTLSSNLNIFSTTDKRGSLSVGSITHDDYEVLLEALETVGETNILSSPRIAVLNNHEAKILVGSSEPYITSETISSTTNPIVSESVNFIDVGVKLFVVPTIHGDGHITMKIRPEVSAATRHLTTSTNNKIPIVETSQAETTITAQDGVTIVIGGLIKDEKIEEFKKVPLLGDIPLLGFAFRSKSYSLVKTELVIFLTPKIMNGDFSVEDQVNF